LEKKYLSTHTTKEGKKTLPQKLNLQKHQTVTIQENTHQKCSKNNQIHKNPMRNMLAAAAAEGQLQTLQQQQQEYQYISSQRNYKRNTKSNPNPTI
jgi:PIN domain nuclease of toxin-antitoxin system